MNPEYSDINPQRDASGAGVEPGGLHSVTEIKLLICYLLTSVDKPISRELITEIILQDSLANYFEIGNAVSELLRQGHLIPVSDAPDAPLSISPAGRQAAGTLEVSLPYTVRTRAVSAAVKLLEKARYERENEVCIEKRSEGGYQVTCRVLDGSAELMSVSLMVADKLQAATVREIFLNDPAVAYSGVLALLTGDINPVFESAWRLRKLQKETPAQE